MFSENSLFGDGHQSDEPLHNPHDDHHRDDWRDNFLSPPHRDVLRDDATTYLARLKFENCTGIVF